MPVSDTVRAVCARPRHELTINAKNGAQAAPQGAGRAAGGDDTASAGALARPEQAAARDQADARQEAALPTATLARIARPFAFAREIRDTLHDGGRTFVGLQCSDGCRPRGFQTYEGALPDGLAELRDADKCLDAGDHCDRCGCIVQAVDGASNETWKTYRAALVRWKAHHEATGEWLDDELAAAWEAVKADEKKVN